MRLEGRTCIVTGATGGLGYHLAARFWCEGASLLLAGRTNVGLEAVVNSLPSSVLPGQKIVTFEGDLRDRSVPAKLIVKAKQEFDSLIVLVNNAAISGPIGPIWENDRQEWEDTVHLNLLVPATLCALVLPWMLSKRGGKIINISGGGAAGPRSGFSAYSTAKAALVRLTETLAQETAAGGIDINALAPGVMRTNMIRQVLAAGPDRIGSSEYEKIRKQLNEGDGVFSRATELATFLASSESNGITGRLLSAPWDAWTTLARHKEQLKDSDVYTLRRIVPEDRGMNWKVG